VTIDGERRTKIYRQVFLAERMGIEKDPSGADEHTPTRCLRDISDQNLIAEVQNGDLFCSDLPHAERPLLNLGPQVEAFPQKYPFASACIIAKHFLRPASIIKEILQKGLGMRKFSRRWVPHSLSDAQKVARVEAAKEMLKILQESEMNDFDVISTGDESWFQHLRHLRQCLPVRQQMLFRGHARQLARKTMITVLFTAKKLIVFDALPRGNTLNHPYFTNSIFCDLKTANPNFRRQKTAPTFWMRMYNSMCHNGSKIMSKIKRKHISRMPHPPY
jgi:hypothetical protein